MAERFKMKAYTGAVIEGGWWGKVVIDTEGIRTDAKLPALREHHRDRAVGVIDSVSKSGSTLLTSGYFVDSRDGREVKSLLAEGYPYQASVGCYPEQIEEVKEGSRAAVNGRVFPGPGVVIRTSHVREISFVSLGADAGTSAKIAASAPHPGAAGQAPRDFAEALQLQLSAGLPVHAAIEAAKRQWPALFDQYRASYYADDDLL